MSETVLKKLGNISLIPQVHEYNIFATDEFYEYEYLKF